MKPSDMKQPATTSADLPEISAEAFGTILKVLKSLRDFNLDIYKDKCIKRRIAIRIRKTSCSSATEYAELLMRDAAEPDHLLKVLTIHVSQFFRNPSTFQKLQDDIFPYLFSRCDPDRRDRRDRLKIWSVGCAGG